MALRGLINRLLPLRGVCKYKSQTVISAAFPYLLPEEYYGGRNVSRYAAVRDYHQVCGARLEQACALLREAFPGEKFDWYCDSSALPEVELAEQACLGMRGKHNLLITKEYGTWVFLGEVVTTVKLADLIPICAAAPHCQKLTVSCTQCAACVRACPTGALDGHQFDKSKCLSFITQKKGGLSLQEETMLKQAGTVWGCDICQQACPHNQNAKKEPLPEFLVNPIAQVTESTPLENRAYAWRPESLLRNIATLSTAACVLPSGISLSSTI